jgi:hypothetical protein
MEDFTVAPDVSLSHERCNPGAIVGRARFAFEARSRSNFLGASLISIIVAAR